MTTDSHDPAPTTSGHNDTAPAAIASAMHGPDTAAAPNAATTAMGMAIAPAVTRTAATSTAATSTTATRAATCTTAASVAARDTATHTAVTSTTVAPGAVTTESATTPTPARARRGLTDTTRTAPAIAPGLETDQPGYRPRPNPDRHPAQPAPALRTWKDTPAMTTISAPTATPDPTSSTTRYATARLSGASAAAPRTASPARGASILTAGLGAGPGTPGATVTRTPMRGWRVSGWALTRILVLLVVQVLMIVVLMTGQASASASPGAIGAQPGQVDRVAFTQPLAPGQNASARLSASLFSARSAWPSRAGSMSCAGQSLNRDGAGDAAGFNLNVVVGPHDRGFTGSGPGPLVVTCGQRGRLVILACAPLEGTGSGHDPAAWDRPPAGRTGWDSAGWDQPGWRGTWRADWRDRGVGSGLSDAQLGLLNQLDPDQLRALLGQHAATGYYPSAGDASGYPSGGVGAGLGLAVGGMRISVGTPIALNQLPAPSAWGAPWTTTPTYSPSYGPSYDYGSSYPDTYGPGYGFGNDSSYGPSSWRDTDGQNAPVLLSSHHHPDSGDHDSDDHDSGGHDSGGHDSGDHDTDDHDSGSDGHHHDGDRDSGREWNGRGLGVCRWIGER